MERVRCDQAAAKVKACLEIQRQQEPRNRRRTRARSSDPQPHQQHSTRQTLPSLITLIFIITGLAIIVYLTWIIM